MRQKFPGVARMQEMRWRMKGQVWDSVHGKWVKFASNAKDYFQATIEHQKQQRLDNEPR